MKFMYIGEGKTEVFGICFDAGESIEVTDEYAIGKLMHNHLFTHNNDAPVAPAPQKRRGRPPKVMPNAQN